MIVIDYETRSRADLTKVGAHNYALDLSTDILCLYMYDLEDDVHYGFHPYLEDFPTEWVHRFEQADYISAVNATFDRLIHEYVGVPEYGFPEVPYNKWYCASAQFRVNAMPANLEDAAKAAKVANLKDPRGKQLIKLLSIPQDDGSFLEDEALEKEMFEYCKKDVLASVDVIRCTRRMTDQEHKDWLLCERMNDKGVKVDLELAKAATGKANLEQTAIAEKITAITAGEITKPSQHQRIKKYVLDAIQDSKDENDQKLLKLMTTFKQGEKKYTLDKPTRESIITAIDETGLSLYEDIEKLIRLLDDASASSVAKFKKMAELADPYDHRVRGAFIHAGASQTHRFSSKGLQLHNMKRKCYSAEQALEVKDKLINDEPIDDIMQTLAKLLRPAIVPQSGHKFIVGDWSAIEARALPWLSDDPRAEKKLDMFRNGIDTYIEAAKGIFNRQDIDADSEERQAGKIAELSLGYGGAAGAFSSMASAYGVVMPEPMVKRIVKVWRRDNAWAVKHWADLEKAAKNAIRKRGSESFKAGRVVYHYVPNMLGGTLVCELPDGTFIHYPFARIEYSEKGDNIVALKASIKPKADEKKKHWGEFRLWGGLLAENNTQAICAGLLRDKIRNLGNLQKYLVAHVHDEIILETPSNMAQSAREGLQSVMESVPEFAKGLPLKAKPVILDRYGNH